MSLIKAIKAQLGLSGDPAKNFTLSVPAAPDGTMKLARGNAGATTQDIMTVDAAGKVGFSVGVLGFQYVAQDLGGFGKRFGVKFPTWLGGLVVNWGTRLNLNYGAAVSTATEDFAIPFANTDYSFIGKRNTGLSSGASWRDEVFEKNSASQGTIYTVAATTTDSLPVSYIAIGT